MRNKNRFTLYLEMGPETCPTKKPIFQFTKTGNKENGNRITNWQHCETSFWWNRLKT